MDSYYRGLFFSADEIYFLVYREQGKIHAIAPLVKIGARLKARLYLIGYHHLFEPGILSTGMKNP